MQTKDKIVLAIFENGGTIESAVNIQLMTKMAYITIHKYVKVLESEGLLNKTKVSRNNNIALTIKGMETGQKLKELKAI